MKTPIQELIETIKKSINNDEALPFMWYEDMLELLESMLQKKIDMFEDIIDIIDSENSGQSAEQRLDEIKECIKTFNTKEK